MKKITFLLVFISIFGYAQTPITDANFQVAINNCLFTNPVDGMCSDSEYGAMPTWDVSNVTDMREAFKETAFNGDISAWDVSNVTTFYQMFYFARNFNQDIGAWDVSKSTNMYSFFTGASAFNQDIGAWDVSSVTDMKRMFSYASAFNQDIGAWDVSNVESMLRLFYNATSFDQDISAWDVSSVNNMSEMFEGVALSVANYDALLTDWSALTLQQGVTFNNPNFQYCTAGAARQSIIDTYGWVIEDAGKAAGCHNSDELTPITDANFQVAINNCLFSNPVDGMCSDSEYGAMPTWDVSNVTDMREAFKETAFNGDISAWDVSNVTTFYQMFSFARNFNQDIGAWDVSKSTNMYSFFTGASAFNQDIGAWDVSSVTDMKRMFSYASAFNQDIGAWDVSNVESMLRLFYNATSFDQDISAWDVSSVNNMSEMFEGVALSVANYDALLTDWSALTLQQGVTFNNPNFQYCTAGAARQSIIDTYGWVIEDAGKAAGCHNSDELTPITDANFQVAINNCLFSNPVNGLCSESEYGAMPTWDVSNVTDMREAFKETAFNGDISAWDVSNVTTFYQMFSFARNFNQDIGAWDVSKSTNMYSFFTGASAFNQDIGAWDVSSVTDMKRMFSYASAFNQDIGAWDVSNVESMLRLFYNATSFDQDISAWDVSSVNNMSEMFEGVALSVANYDALLTDWSALTLQQGVTFNNPNFQYCTAGAARQSIIDTYGWVIEDAGLNCTTAGLEDEHLFAISIYPNPTNNTLFITGNETPTAVAIYNVLGKEVLFIKNTNNINVQALPSGVYMIRISDGVGQTNRKFIKN